jgi:hypothetical protein
MTGLPGLSGFAVGFSSFHPETRQGHCHRNERPTPRLSEMSGFCTEEHSCPNRELRIPVQSQAIRAAERRQNFAIDLSHEWT